MDDEQDQENIVDLESDDSADDTTGDSQPDQIVGEDDGDQGDQSQAPKKQPKIWQVVRGIQKTLEEMKTPPKEQPAKPEAQPPSTNQDTLSREEAILIAQGMDTEDLDELKDVAKAKDLPLLKAKETPLFQAYLEKKADDAKKEKAKLGSSKGSQVQQEQKIGELSRDEHMEVTKELMSKVR